MGCPPRDPLAESPGRAMSAALADIATLPIWVAWQTEDRPDGKPTKVPYSPLGGKAKADNPQTWGARAQAEERAARLPKPVRPGWRWRRVLRHRWRSEPRWD